jgi:hypothetical protein
MRVGIGNLDGSIVEVADATATEGKSGIESHAARSPIKSPSQSSLEGHEREIDALAN